MKGSMGLSRRDMTLEMILEVLLHNAIGRKFFIFLTLSYLRIRVRNIAFSAGRTLPDLCDAYTNCHTSSLRIV
jgi:hypothetical protein